MVTVFITRHAQPVPTDAYDGDRPKDKPLSDLGRQQAAALGRRLREEEGFSGDIFASPFRRCLATAEHLCRAGGFTFVPAPALGELSGGWLAGDDGVTMSVLRDRYDHLTGDANALDSPDWPGTDEGPASVEARVEAFLDAQLHGRSADLLLVGHGATSGAAVNVLAGTGVESELTGSAGYNLHYNAALTAIEVTGEPALRFGNDTTHLAAEQRTSNATIVSE